jgi:hypothetical protein
MGKFRNGIVGVLVWGLVSGCASTHPGWIASASNNTLGRNLIVSIQKDYDLSDDANSFYDFTFESKDLNWLKIDSAQVLFEDQDRVISNLIVGKDLIAWAESQQQKAMIRNHNMNMAITGAILAGTVAVIAAGKGQNRNTGLAKTGAAVAVGAIGVQVAEDIKKSIKEVEQSPAVPETHILSGGFIVPANGLIKKWFLVSFPQKQRPSNGQLVLKTVEGDTLSFQFSLDRPKVR